MQNSPSPHLKVTAFFSNVSFAEQFPTIPGGQQSTPQLSEGSAYTSSHFLSGKKHRVRNHRNKKRITLGQDFFEGDGYIHIVLYSLCVVL